jgi:hypothetical protein
VNLALLIGLFFGGEPQVGGPSLARKLTCMDRIDHHGGPQSAPFLSHSQTSSLGLRWDYLRVFADGQVWFSVQIYDFGAIECQAALTPERLAVLKSDLAGTKFWRLPNKGGDGAREVVSFSAKLDEDRTCDIKMKLSQWTKSAVALSVQAALDRLKREICGGSCPEPKERHMPSGKDR